AGPLFETTRHTPYSPRRIQQLVQETAALAGITKRVHPHLLRHSVATRLLERGMPLEQIQQFLGHAKLETTQVYAESTTAMIKDSYQRRFPQGENDQHFWVFQRSSRVLEDHGEILQPGNRLARLVESGFPQDWVVAAL